MNDETLKAQTHAAIMAVWEANKATYMARVALLERAATAWCAGELSPEAREEAAGEAHKVAGAVGTFGYAEASRLAREVERMLKPGATLEPGDGDRLLELTTALRAALSTDAAG